MAEPDKLDERGERLIEEAFVALVALPDYYVRGADGGLYHSLDPDRAKPILRLLADRERRLEGEAAPYDATHLYYAIGEWREAAEKLAEAGRNLIAARDNLLLVRLADESDRDTPDVIAALKACAEAEDVLRAALSTWDSTRRGR